MKSRFYGRLVAAGLAFGAGGLGAGGAARAQMLSADQVWTPDQGIRFAACEMTALGSKGVALEAALVLAQIVRQDKAVAAASQDGELKALMQQTMQLDLANNLCAAQLHVAPLPLDPGPLLQSIAREYLPH